MALNSRTRSFWVAMVVGPMISIVAFFGTYLADPIKFGDKDGALAAVPSLALAVLLLFITVTIASHVDSTRSVEGTDRIYEAVKNYLHVTKLGTTQHAWAYVMARLPAIEEVRNTSFNLVDEMERPVERLYGSEVYQQGPRKVATASARGLRWKDVGDSLALTRFREFSAAAQTVSDRASGGYSYRLVSGADPQLNFILLTYPDQSKEVLFNWDYRSIEREPTVLLSRDADIVSMFEVQFGQLWRRASEDHDKTATRSTPKK